MAENRIMTLGLAPYPTDLTAILCAARRLENALLATRMGEIADEAG
jgi:hypothetical protein